MTAAQAADLEQILQVPRGQRRSRLGAWRRGPTSPSGRGLVLALDRVPQIAGLHLGLHVAFAGASGFARSCGG